MLISIYSLALLAILAGLPHFNLLRQVTGMRSSHTFYVRPTYNHDCKTCVTFSESLNLLMSTTGATFYFLPGNHSVENTTQVAIKDIRWLSLQGNVSKSSNHARIHCKGKMSFTFKKVGDLFISDLEFVGCGYEIPQQVRGVNAALKIYGTNSLTLMNVTVRDSYGYGLLALNTIHDTIIIGCKFYHNRLMGRLKRNSDKGLGGNALIIFCDMFPTYHIHLKISNSEFAHGTESYDGDMLTDWSDEVRVRGAGGLGIVVSMSEADNNISIIVCDCIFYNNSGVLGANMAIVSKLDEYFDNLVPHKTSTSFFSFHLHWLGWLWCSCC